ncbi:phage tail tube protein [Paenarthrobacter nicotinovorans]|uniref:phage tail tube protein n=1 Tax=Paenarthrobacter nicotinovorans TaxID=29320 RepID=UPI003818E794
MSASLARRFKVEVSANGTDWLPFKGINDFNNSENATTQSTADYDNNGFDSFEKTLTGWQVVVKANRPTTAGVFDPGQELVRAARFKFGDAARVYVRWYDRNGAPEAYSGKAMVEWNQSKTGVADIEEVTATFKGDGVLAPIANPYNAAAVPVIASATPTGATAGTTVTIQGANFTGTVPTTGVKFGATNASNWQVISDSLISAVVPAGSSGAANIVVTNGAGASTAFPYTRGA